MKWRAQTTFEYLLFIGAGILFVVIVILATRGSTVGTSGLQVEKSQKELGAQFELIKSNPPKERIKCLYDDTAYQKRGTIAWTTELPATTNVNFCLGYNCILNKVAGSSAYSTEHYVHLNIPTDSPSNILFFQCISCTASGGCISSEVFSYDMGPGTTQESCQCNIELGCGKCDYIPPYYCTNSQEIILNSSACGCRFATFQNATNGCDDLIIKGNQTIGITPTSAVITWNTAVFSNSRIDYGSSLPYSQNSFDPASVSSHSVSLSSLNPTTQYHYQISSCNATLCNSTSDVTFTTLALPNQPPVISISSPSAGTVLGTINIDASASDPDGTISGVQFLLDGSNLGSQDISAPYSLSWDSRTVSNGTHIVSAIATDNASAQTTSAVVSINVQNDFVSPAAITNLFAVNYTSANVTLNWTAPGDDANMGAASSYDLRYSTSPITPANFYSASKATSIPAPKAPGSSEYFNVTSLSISTTYYFAIITSDEVPNNSTISNVVNATTPPFCLDSDGGMNPFIAGFTTTQSNSIPDACSVNLLQEYNCTGAIRALTSVFCDACQTSTAGYCANCYKRGTTATNKSDTKTDGCVTPPFYTTFRQYFCSGARITYTDTPNSPSCQLPP